MNPLIPVMFGGALGAGARHLVAAKMLARLGPGFPWWTLSINIAGGLLMGLLVGLLAKAGGNETVRLFVGVGVLGGFTTFSAFSLETWQLMERGQLGTALGYVLASVVGSVVTLWLGLAVART